MELGVFPLDIFKKYPNFLLQKYFMLLLYENGESSNRKLWHRSFYSHLFLEVAEVGKVWLLHFILRSFL